MPQPPLNESSLAGSHHFTSMVCDAIQSAFSPAFLFVTKVDFLLQRINRRTHNAGLPREHGWQLKRCSMPAFYALAARAWRKGPCGQPEVMTTGTPRPSRVWARSVQ